MKPTTRTGARRLARSPGPRRRTGPAEPSGSDYFANWSKFMPLTSNFTTYPEPLAVLRRQWYGALLAAGQRPRRQERGRRPEL